MDIILATCFRRTHPTYCRLNHNTDYSTAHIPWGRVPATAFIDQSRCLGRCVSLFCLCCIFRVCSGQISSWGKIDCQGIVPKQPNFAIILMDFAERCWDAQHGKTGQDPVDNPARRYNSDGRCGENQLPSRLPPISRRLRTIFILIKLTFWLYNKPEP